MKGEDPKTKNRGKKKVEENSRLGAFDSVNV